MHSKRVAVIGAGPAGMAAAHALATAGLVTHVYEASPQVGGLTRSFKLWGEIVDLGPHAFASSDPDVLALWKLVVGPNHRMLMRDTRIAIGGRVYRYPLQTSELLRGLGLSGSMRAALGYARARLSPRGAAGTAERLFTKRFGTHLYAFFFRPYCRKLWGRDPSDVDESFAAALLGDASFSRTLVRLAAGGGGPREALPQASFPYAADGAGAFCTRAATRVAQLGGSVRLSAPVTRVLSEDLRVTGIGMGNARYAYDWVVSSMPLSSLLRSLDDELPSHVTRALSRLRFRSTVLVYLRVRGRGIVPHPWLYVSAGLRAGRITNFARWQGSLDPEEQTIAVEYWCDEHDPLFTSDDGALRVLATRELALLKASAPALSVDDAHVVRLRNTHPVQHRSHERAAARIRAHLSRYTGLTVMGHASAHAYAAQACALAIGLDTAQHVLACLGVPRADAPASHGALGVPQES